MAKGKKVDGICRLCGQFGRLSFEHVPPEAAFNSSKVIQVDFEQAINFVPGEEVRGRQQQRGAGGYTLCERCNNVTGAWYAKRFIGFSYRGMEIIKQTRGKGSILSFIYPLFPLAVIKQIVTMFLASCHENFVKAAPELAHFVLNRDEKYLSDKYRFYIYHNVSTLHRNTGMIATLSGSSVELLSEISFPPFGYVMTLDNDVIPDKRLVEISFFANYRYEDFKVFNLKLPLLEVNTVFPADYRSRDEIMIDVQRNRENIDRLGRF